MLDNMLTFAADTRPAFGAGSELHMRMETWALVSRALTGCFNLCESPRP